MVHASRQWLDDNREDLDAIMLSDDWENAFGLADNHTFLEECAIHAAGMATFAEWLYGGEPARLYFGEDVILSKRGGHQGCPLMMALFCLVQRKLQVQAGVFSEGPGALDMKPAFADDSNMAGKTAVVLQKHKKMTQLAEELGMRYKFSKSLITTAAGEAYTGDLSGFDARIEINKSGNAKFLKSPVGSNEFCKAVVDAKVDEMICDIQAVAKLPDAHAALYILRHSANSGGINYLSRTTPPSCIRPAAERLDSAMRQAVSDVVGRPLDDKQWKQCTLPRSDAGLGLRSAAKHAPAAYIGSRQDTRHICKELRPAQRWEDGSSVEDECQGPLADACAILDAELLTGRPTRNSLLDKKAQTGLSMLINKQTSKELLETSTQWHRARLRAYAEPGANRWLEAQPSQALATHLTNEQISHAAGQLLGCELDEADLHCQFCSEISDAYGCHAQSCMAGGDATLRHNEGRNLIHRHCLKAGLAPRMEVRGLLWNGIATGVVDHRPADVLVSGEFAAISAGPHARAALDFGVTNALSPSNFKQTAEDPTSAARAYAELKRGRDATADLCEAAGIRYMPIVMSSQGGSDRESVKALKQLHRLVAAAQSAPVGEIRRRFEVDLSLILIKANYRAWQRRSTAYRQEPPEATAQKAAMSSALILEEPQT